MQVHDFSVIHGRSAVLSLRLGLAQGRPDPEQTACALQGLLAAAGCPTRLALSAACHPASADIDRVLFVDNDARPAGLHGTVTAVRALRGVSRALCPRLDTLIVSPASGDEGPGSVLDLGRSIAAQYRRAVVVVDEIGSTVAGPDIQVQTVAEVLDDLTASRGAPAVLVVSQPIGHLLRDVCISLAGAAASAVSLSIGSHVQCVAVRTPRCDEAASCDAALVPALVLLLAQRGRRDVAERLERAWLRTLEDGLQLAGLPNLKPYGRTVTTHEFLGAITERVGTAPRDLKPSLRPDQARPTQPALRVVR